MSFTTYQHYVGDNLQTVNPIYKNFFSKQNIFFLSREISNRLTNIYVPIVKATKNVTVSDENIKSVMDSIYIHQYNNVDLMNEMVVNYIVEYVKDTYEIEKNNGELDIWITKYLEDDDLVRYPKIKLREKRPTQFIFHNNY